MGTSHAATAPNTVGWIKVSESLKAPQINAGTVVVATLSAVVPWIPPGHIVRPVVAVAAEGIRFAYEVREKGLQEASKSEMISLPKRFVVFGVSDGLWKVAASNVPPEYINTPYGRLAEIAFKKTMSNILLKGIEAMEEVGR